jgi:hypothetical protein
MYVDASAAGHIPASGMKISGLRARVFRRSARAVISEVTIPPAVAVATAAAFAFIWAEITLSLAFAIDFSKRREALRPPTLP